jgi:hypothetical protein
MAWHKYLRYPGAVAIILSVELLSFSVAAPQFRGQSQLVSVSFPPASQRGAPARTAGGGQRSPDCVDRKSLPLTVLAPDNNLGTTISGNPTLFWYIPKTKAKSAEFVVLDDKEDEVYQTTLALKGVPGVVKLSLPETVSLASGKSYRWLLSLKCNTKDSSMDEFVMGNLERMELKQEDKTKLAEAKEPLQQAQVYAGARIWQETVAILAQLRQARPDDPKVRDAWKELLQSVNLDAIADAPLVECCIAEQ